VEFDHFKIQAEEKQTQLGWTAKRELAKLNYHIHTDAHNTGKMTESAIFI